MRRLVGLIFVGILTLTASCGTGANDVPDTIETEADETASDVSDTDGDTGQAADEPQDGISDPAPVGEIVIEVGGETYTAEISDCQLEADGPIVIQSESGSSPYLVLNLGRQGGQFGALNAGVTLDDGRSIGLSTNRFTAAVDGDSVEVTSGDFMEMTNAEQLGDGSVKATCP